MGLKREGYPAAQCPVFRKWTLKKVCAPGCRPVTIPVNKYVFRHKVKYSLHLSYRSSCTPVRADTSEAHASGFNQTRL